jgi:putative phage-type endonuclease
MTQQTHEYIDDYVQTHRLAMSSPVFYEKLIVEVADGLFEEWANLDLCLDEDYAEVVSVVSESVEIYRASWLGVPLRQEPTVDETALSLSETAQRLDRVLSHDAEKQRTPEWYASRHNLLTASNLWKVFGTQAQYNSLVYEKCLPMSPGEKRGGINPDSDNPMNHGIKYEPISIALYERRYGTRVREIGCVPHETYSYIGASPDGINADPTLPRYGRMIEIKNVVNREITGVPLESYWIQMQLQMEACDLEECDFIETRIREFQDIHQLIGEYPEKTPEGMILYFIPRITIGESTPVGVETEYAYLPLEIRPLSDEAAAWTDAERARRPQHVLYRTTYWILDQFSCVLVRRNRAWFAAAQPKIAEAWNTILAERETGYEHRAAVSKKKRTEVVCSGDTTTHYIKNMPVSNNICLVKLES